MKILLHIAVTHSEQLQSPRYEKKMFGQELVKPSEATAGIVTCHTRSQNHLSLDSQVAGNVFSGGITRYIWTTPWTKF